MEDGALKPSWEVHFCGLDREVEGAKAVMEFVAQVRDEKKFESLDALKIAISEDVSRVKSFFGHQDDHGFVIDEAVDGHCWDCVLDQLSKHWIDSALGLCTYAACDRWTLSSWLQIVVLYNEGAAFSFLSDAGGWQRWFLLILSSVVSVAIACGFDH